MNKSISILGLGILVAYFFSCTSKKQISQIAEMQLGRMLFFDKDLSINQSKSCASCHDPKLYFTDGYRRAVGTYGDVMARNTPSLINSASLKSYNWANPEITTYQQQMRTPLFSEQHLEMGMHQHNETEAQEILSKSIYKAYIKHKPLTWATIINALATYQKSLISRNSKYDQYLAGKVKLNETELQGESLFFSQKLKCSQCHGGADFNTPLSNFDRFVNTGIYNEQNEFNDSGLALSSNKAEDIGKFRIPSLRNVAATAPYYHDGSAFDLREVIDNYAKANIFPNQKISTTKHPLITGFSINTQEKRNLIAFLNTLTDSSAIAMFAISH